MIQTRRALLAAFIVGGGAVQTKAGCFDWLCGKTTTPNLPYAVGYAPPTTITPLGPPVAVGAPMYSAPFGVAPVAGFAQPGNTTGGVYTANFGAWNTPSALQMPAYGTVPQPINNPSVLSGMPVNPSLGQAPVSMFRTTINPAIVAPQGTLATPQTAFNAQAAFQAQTPHGAAAIPQTAIAPGVMAQPMYAPAPGATSGGWFGKVWGNNYQTNYNNVPTTVFRPVQQIDPATGQTVIVQQPCVTNTQQVQRAPFTGLQPAPAQQPYYGEPTCGSEPPRYQAPNQFGAAPALGSAPQYQGQAQQYQGQVPAFQGQTSINTPQGYGATGGYGPTGGYGATGGYDATGGYGATGSGVAQTGAVEPAPYGVGANGYNGYPAPAPSTDPVPLQGQPQTTLPPNFNPGGTTYPNGSPSGNGQPSDQSRIEQPTLGSSQWGRSERTPYEQPRSQPIIAPSTNVSTKYTDLPPIPASDDYRPPSWESQSKPLGRPFLPESSQQPSPNPVISPPSWNDRTAQRLTEPRDGEQSIRYASQPQLRPRAPETDSRNSRPARADGGWFPVGQ